MPVMLQSTDLSVVMTKRTFQYLVDNTTGQAFHRVSRHETSRLTVFLNVYLSVLRIPRCVRFSRIVSLPHTSFYLPYSRLYILMHYFITYALSSNPCRPSLHILVVGVNWFSWHIKVWSVRKICPCSRHENTWLGGDGNPRILKLAARW